MLVPFEDREGDRIYLNPDYMTRVYPCRGGSNITMSDGETDEVKQTPDEVYAHIEYFMLLEEEDGDTGIVGEGEDE